MPTYMPKSRQTGDLFRAAAARDPSLMPLAELTREGVKSFVDAQKELMGVMIKQHNGHKPASKPVKHARRRARGVKKEKAHAAAAAV